MKTPISHNVSTDKHIVWRAEGGQSCYIELDVGMWEKNAYLIKVSPENLATRLMDGAVVDRFESQFLNDSWTNSSAGRASVDLSESQDRTTAESFKRSNSDLNGGAMLDEIINRLAMTNSWSKGVLCHLSSRITIRRFL